ncbi:ABC transporter permease subunit [Nonomuraea pusilla]|uniref:ABC-2 type transport system permease protein n=1 Tax=Nonomuraea pusilla TaxID=46177 RepID=A0A1H7G915_9ACTN|nr:ABC transporter permease subunit [Nonomuraea pusilla]SEK34564.1 ABC-2 type transport system permease protein [Nonomuraea pusilla]
MTRPVPGTGTRLREVHAEWTKLRTAPGTLWTVLALVAVTVATSAAASALVSCPSSGCGHDAVRIGLAGVQAGQAVTAVAAVLAITGEYGTGMIRATFTAMPRRGAVLAAKAVVVAGLTLASGTVAVLGSLLAARLVLPHSGFTPEHGFPPLSLADGPTLRAAAGSVLYLALIALFSLGVATAVRDSAAAAGVVLGLLYALAAVPFVMVPDPDWQLLLWRISPMNAGLAVQSTANLSALPLTPWQGVAVLTAWTAASLLLAALLLRRRDA